MHCISIDWLQTHNVTQADYDEPRAYGNFILKNIGRRSHFKDVYDIFTFKEVDGKKEPVDYVAQLACHPDKGILKKDSSFLKIINRFLYNTDLKKLILELNEALQLKFKNISRVDLACDFHIFKNNLDPANFINRCIVLRPEYIKMGHGKFYSVGVYGETYNSYPYIRWGTSKSNLYYYLYDKTLELKEKVDKPWIREKWKLDGLDDSQSIYRLEFAIHSCSKGLIGNDESEEWIANNEAKKFLKLIAPVLPGLKRKMKLLKSHDYETYCKEIDAMKLLIQDKISLIKFLKERKKYCIQSEKKYLYKKKYSISKLKLMKAKASFKLSIHLKKYLHYKIKIERDALKNLYRRRIILLSYPNAADFELIRKVKDAKNTVQVWKDNKEEITADAVYFSSLKVLDNFEEVYRALFHRYFDFRFHDTQAKKCRMRKVPLLDLEKPSKLVMNIVDKIESNRTDKMNMKALIELNKAARVKELYANQDMFEMQKSFEANEKLINFFIQSRGAGFLEWVKNKFPEEYERLNVQERNEHSSEVTNFNYLPASKASVKKEKESLFLKGEIAPWNL